MVFEGLLRDTEVGPIGVHKPSLDILRQSFSKDIRLLGRGLARLQPVLYDDDVVRLRLM